MKTSGIGIPKALVLAPALAAFIGTIWAANWALGEWGIVAIGFGLTAPAGVYFAGLSFTARDFIHEHGRLWVIGAILVGAALSYALEDAQDFAIASGVAFLASEALDMMVYTPLRKRSWLWAVALSNTVGLLVDSALFLWLAFGSLNHIEGLIVGKLIMTGLAVGALALWRMRDLPVGDRLEAVS